MDDRQSHISGRAVTPIPGTRVASEIRWVFHVAKDFSKHSVVWDEINQSTHRSPVLTSAFMTILLRDFGTDRKLLAIGYKGETVQAIGVIHRKRSGVWKTFQPAQAPLGAWLHRPTHTF